MIIESKEREVTIEGDFKNKEFFIDKKNTVHIIKILRNKLYSDKVLAVMREYITNAIDATVDNSSTQAVKVHLPSESDSYFKVRDFGKGLSNREIENIFISYGNSTKRNSDEFTGCLGIGSKSAFSYAESFLIVSVKSGIKTTYMSYLDESGLGSISQLSSIQTNEESGIEICVPVKDSDIYSFKETFINYYPAINFPIEVSGINISEYQSKLLPIYSEDIGISKLPKSSVVYFNSDEIFLSKNSSFNGIFVYMGNVAYKVDSSWFNKFVDQNLLTDYHFFVFKVAMGEIEFSSNRESIEQTPENANVLKDYIQRFKEFYSSSIEVDFLSNSPNLMFYKSLALGIKFSKAVLENSDGQLFNLNSFEYELDFKKILDNVDDIRVKGFFPQESSNNIFMRTVIENKSSFEYWQKLERYKFKNNSSCNNFPLLVVSTGNMVKDDEILYFYKQKCIELGSHVTGNEISTMFPDSYFLRYLPGTKTSKYRSGNFPFMFIVEPKDLTTEEFIEKANKSGFKAVSIEFFKHDILKKEKTSHFKMHVLSPEFNECVEIPIEGKVTKKLIESELSKFGYSPEDCIFVKAGEVSSIEDVKISSSRFPDNYFFVNPNSKSGVFLLKVFQEETQKVPILISTTQQSFGVNYLSKKAFSVLFSKTIEIVVSKLSSEEKYYLKYSSLSSNDGKFKIKHSQDLNSMFTGLGFDSITDFKSNVTEIENALKTCNVFRNSYKNNNIYKNIRNLSYASSKYIKECKLTLSKERIEFIKHLRDAIGSGFVNYVPAEVTINSNNEIEDFMVNQLNKVLKRYPLFFVYTNHIINKFLYSYGYYHRKYVLNDEGSEKFNNFVTFNKIGDFKNGKIN